MPNQEQILYTNLVFKQGKGWKFCSGLLTPKIV